MHMFFKMNINSRCWVAAHMCVLSHFRTCDVRAEVRAERVCELCVRCRCVRYIFDLRCAIALFILVDKAADEYVYDLRFTYSSAPLSTRIKSTDTYYTYLRFTYSSASLSTRIKSIFFVDC